jgi:outer membrane receptor protein involved in Fe transport
MTRNINTQHQTVKPTASRLRRLLLSASAAAILASFAGAAWAGAAATAGGLDEVAVTAISGKQLDKYSMRTIEEIAAGTPQLSVTRGSSGSGATISLRGIGSPYTSIGIEQSVAVNVDGVYYGQGRIINEGFFDMSQVEILKGPQALFFGKNATAGVLSFTSANPTNHFEALGRVGYEFTAKQSTIEAMVSGPVSDTFGLRIAVRAAVHARGATCPASRTWWPGLRPNGNRPTSSP